MAREHLSLSEARRIALAAGGFGAAPPRTVHRGNALRTISRLGLIQIDSVNVAARAHEMPLWSRLGNAFDPALLLRLAHKDRALFEYWGHEASFIPIETRPSILWKQQEVRDGTGGSSNKWWAKWTRSNGKLLDRVLQEVRDRGPLAASDIEMAARSEKWWGWQDERKALEWLYSAGQVAVSGRRSTFEREYDLPERIWPDEVLAAPLLSPEEAKRNLVRIALRACGVGTAADLADHFRMRTAEAKVALEDMVASGEALPVTVEGWKQPAFLDPQARAPRGITHQTLLSPFDPLVWNRKRAERLFGFNYRIEIYVPAPKRVYGYYVLPYLEDERLAARLDLKADRKASVLLVLSAHSEPEGPDPARLAETLRSFAAWRGLDTVRIDSSGELADQLRAATGTPKRRRARAPRR